MTREEAILSMNQYGSSGEPFIFLIDFEMEKPLVIALKDMPANVLFDFQGYRNYSNPPVIESFTLHATPPPLEIYKEAFDKVMHELNYGNSFLLNLTYRSKLNNDINLKHVFATSKAKYRLLLKNEFVVFSPETFIQIKDGFVYSYPMKGTIDASIKNAEKLLLESEKEEAEHYTIVDLIRNDLSIIAKDVQVTKFRYLDYIKSDNGDLFQASSEIRGMLPKNYHRVLGDLIFSLLPAGSISGAPKKKTIEIIQSVEGTKRGYYTGVAGIFDGSQLDSFVMIRYIEKEQKEYYYRSGGGITNMSDLETEYNELIQKIYVPTH